MEFSKLIGPLIGGCFVMVFFIVGITLIVKSIRDKKKAEASTGWPSTPGTITESTIQESVSTDSDGDRRTSFVPIVHYSYQVVGTAYEGKRISFGARSAGSYQSAQQIISVYPKGSSAPVYYDPLNPADAVLERKSASSKVMLILGIVFLAISTCTGLIGVVSLILSYMS